jgi:MATE family multidrug resistance protein
MLLATAAYFGLFYSLEPAIGNNALWLAFTSFMALRGVFQFFMSRRLQTIYAQAEK